jgi:diacylglycerol kinase (ATP)
MGKIMRVVFIVNPVADRGKAKHIWESLQEQRQRQYEHSCEVFTEYPGHAQEIASRVSKEDCDIIVSVGGDGTIHEIVNGIIGKNISLGIIPAGSGNDLARTLGIAKEHREALQNINKGKDAWVDIGLAGERYFINIGGVGFDAEVVADMNNNMRFLRGTAAYVASVVKKLITFVPVHLEITIDGKSMQTKCIFAQWQMGNTTVEG